MRFAPVFICRSWKLRPPKNLLGVASGAENCLVREDNPEATLNTADTPWQRERVKRRHTCKRATLKSSERLERELQVLPG